VEAAINPRAEGILGATQGLPFAAQPVFGGFQARRAGNTIYASAASIKK
jgi:hypothetical protein